MCDPIFLVSPMCHGAKNIIETYIGLYWSALCKLNLFENVATFSSVHGWRRCS